MGAAKWTDELTREEAKKFTNGTDFAKYAPGAYNYAKKHGIFDEVTAHFIPRWEKKYADKETCRKIAAQYNTKIEFLKACDGAYSYAVRHGFLDEICAHMVRGYFGRWNDDSVYEEAQRYDTRKDFQNGACGAWNYAHKHGILDYVCAHMDILGNRVHRCIYVAEFSDMHVYVGLTYNANERWHNHLSSDKSAVNIHIKATGERPIFKIVIDYEELSKAIVDEGKVLDDYIEKGWTPLNRVKTGATGGRNRKWTKESCIKSSIGFSTYKEWCKAYSGAYSAACKCGYLEDIKEFHPEWKIIKKISNEEIYEVAKGYTNRALFKKEHKNLYEAAQARGIVEDVCKNMESNVYFQRNNATFKNDIPIEEIEFAARKYNTKIAFHDCDRIYYLAAKRLGILKEVCSHMRTLKTRKGIKLPKVTRPEIHIEILRDSAQKFNTKKEFYEKDRINYLAAKRQKVLNEICLHMNPYRKNKTNIPYEELEREAKKYNTSTAFQKGSPKYYNYALRNKLLYKVMAHSIRNRKWTVEIIQNRANLYEYRSDFMNHDRHAYDAAIDLGILDEVCAHMKYKHKKPRDYTDKLLRETAAIYKYRKAMQKADPAMYMYLHSHALLDKYYPKRKPRKKDL